MRITIVCDQFTLEDVTALGRYLRDRYKSQSHEVSVLVESQTVPAAEAVAAFQAIFGSKPHWVQTVRFKRGGGNGNK